MRRRYTTTSAAGVGTILYLYLAAAGWAGEGIELLPAEVTLHGKESSHRLLVHEVVDGELGRQLDDVTWESSDPQVARVESGIVYPVADGTAEITVQLGDHTSRALVHVTAIEDEHSWSFQHDVLPVMAKLGCNAGACHGALAGKGGFRLSFMGYDPETDWYTITRQARGRRVELSDPGRSLIVAKPSGAIPHEGGLRFVPDSLEYRVLVEWIASGAPRPPADEPELERLEILPPRALLQPGDSQQVVVQAHYTDGRVRDVTHWAKYSSTDESVAHVDDDGTVQVIGHGEGAVTAWYSSHVVVARVTSPYDNVVDPEVFVEAERRNFIDDLVLEQLERLNVPPSPPADDVTFLRRVYVDTIGTMPTPEEAERFLGDPSPDKRDKLIDQLLSRPEFVSYWAHKWSDMMLVNGTLLRPEAVRAYYEWIHESVATNTPWDEFVRQVLTAQGSSLENGATNFYALHQDPESLTENVSQAFLGLSLNCAQCHNHPLEKWTNDQYYAMANLFGRVRAKGWGGDGRSGDGKRTLYVAASGDVVQPITGVPQPPAPLDAEPLPIDSPEDRRVFLAEWMTAAENPYFARAITNRVWANFFGVGLVDPVDDMRVSNPASNEELLSAAASYVVEHNYDLKELMRAILQSAAYQRSSDALPENQDETRFYSRYYPRRMRAEVLLDAISQVTDVPTEFAEILYPGADRRATDFYPKGTRALELFDSAVDSYFLQTFGRNPRNITCECERSDEPSMVQVLHISNGETINQKLQTAGSRVDQLLQQDLPDEQLIEQIYLLSLSRPPTEGERSQLLVELAAADDEDKRLLVEDVFWAVLSSREFLFNH